MDDVANWPLGVTKGQGPSEINEVEAGADIASEAASGRRWKKQAGFIITIRRGRKNMFNCFPPFNETINKCYPNNMGLWEISGHV